MKKPIFYPTVEALVGFDETDIAEADAQDIREALVDHMHHLGRANVQLRTIINTMIVDIDIIYD